MIKLLKLKIVPVLVSVILALSPLALSVSAAVWEGSGSIGVTNWGPIDGNPYQVSEVVSFPYTGALGGLYFGRTYNGNRLDLRDISWSSPISIYISGYMRQSYRAAISEVGDPYNVDNYEVQYKNSVNQSEVVKPDYITIWTPNDAGTSNTSDGMTLVVSLEASEISPISGVFIRPVEECGFLCTKDTTVSDQISNTKASWYWQSVRIIGAESAEELAALDNVASEIIAGNDILESMKGDLVAILQDIYREVGDLGVAANTANLILGVIRDTLYSMASDVSNINISAMAIARMVQQRLPEILSAINSNGEIIAGKLDDLIALLAEGTGEALEETNQDVGRGEIVQDGLGELAKPEVDSVVPELGDFSGDADVGSVSAFLGVIFSNSLVTSMLMISLTMAFAAYVLYGKR